MSETDRPSPELLDVAGAAQLLALPGGAGGGLVLLAAGATEAAWAQRAAARVGRRALLVSAPDGLAEADLAVLLPRAAAAAPAPVLMGIGAGAMAALAQAATVSATAVIAIAPAGPVESPRDPDAAPAILVYDPRLAAAPPDGLRGVPMPHAGAALPEALLAGGALAEAIAALEAGDPARAAMTLRVARLAAPRLKAGLASRLAASGHPRMAEVVTRRAPAGEGPLGAQVRVLQRLGRAEEALPLAGTWVRRQPQSALAHRRRAACHLALDQPIRAVAALRGAIAQGPVPLLVHARLVRTLMRLQRHDEASEAARAAVAALPGEAEPQALLGEVLLRGGERAAAAEAFAGALAIEPGHAVATAGAVLAADPGGPEEEPGAELAAHLAALGPGTPARRWAALLDLAAALRRPAVARAAATAAAAWGADAQVLSAAARLLAETGDHATAEAAWRRAAQAAPQQAEPWLGHAEALRAQRRDADAAKVLAAAAQLHPRHAAIAVQGAEACLAAGDPVGAERAARRALALDPRAEALHLLLADALWRQHRGRDALQAARAGYAALGTPAIGARVGHLLLMQGAAAEAAEAFRQVADQPNAPAHVWLGLTDALWRAGRLEAAEAAARQALAAFPRHVELRTRLGQLLLAGGDAEAAVAALAEVVAEEPGSEVVQLAVADALWRQGRRAEALAAAREVAAVAPGQAAVAARLGHLLLENGDVEEAVAEFERALSLDAELIPAWTGLCDAERTRKRIKPAIAAYRRAEALGMDRVTRRMLRFRLFGELEE